MTRNVALFNRLIAFYKDNPPDGWGYSQCVAGRISSWSLVPNLEMLSESAICELLGIDEQSMFHMIYGGTFEFRPAERSLDERRALVVKMLETARDTGKVDYGWAGKVRGAYME